ncbi:GNAT family N-acetyltransferase [Lachnospiraceae bacterium 56-18]
MICKIRKWDLADAADLAAALSNRKVQDNLRDGLPYPYTEQDGVDFISAMLSADENETFAFAIIADGRVVGSIGVFRQGNIHRQTAELVQRCINLRVICTCLLRHRFVVVSQQCHRIASFLRLALTQNSVTYHFEINTMLY